MLVTQTNGLFLILRINTSHEEKTIIYLKKPMMHSNIPTRSANKMASSVYSSSDGSTIPPKALETRRETNATGPTASWRDEPNTAYTNTGTNEESTNKTK